MVTGIRKTKHNHERKNKTAITSQRIIPGRSIQKVWCPLGTKGSRRPSRGIFRFRRRSTLGRKCRSPGNQSRRAVPWEWLCTRLQPQQPSPQASPQGKRQSTRLGRRWISEKGWVEKKGLPSVGMPSRAETQVHMRKKVPHQEKRSTYH